MPQCAAGVVGAACTSNLGTTDPCRFFSHPNVRRNYSGIWIAGLRSCSLCPIAFLPELVCAHIGLVLRPRKEIPFVTERAAGSSAVEFPVDLEAVAIHAAIPGTALAA